MQLVQPEVVQLLLNIGNHLVAFPALHHVLAVVQCLQSVFAVLAYRHRHPRALPVINIITMSQGFVVVDLFRRLIDGLIAHHQHPSHHKFPHIKTIPLFISCNGVTVQYHCDPDQILRPV